MSNNRDDRKTIRRQEAQQRTELRATRTNAQQLQMLEARGVTSGKEVTRLMANIIREGGDPFKDGK